MKQLQVNIEVVTHNVIQKIGNPVNTMVVLATLESMGMREKDVFRDFGFVTLRDLSLHIFENLKKKPLEDLLNTNERKKKKQEPELIAISDYLWMKAKLLVQYYPLGIFHLFPVFLQVVAIILFGYSLWTFIGFNIVQSTSVVFGVILGLVISGGFVQVLGRQASFYWHHKEYHKTKMVIDRLIRAGISAILLTFMVLTTINLFFGLYPLTFVAITFIYALLIGVLLLVTAPFHTIRQRWVISLAIFIATVIALLLKFYTGIHIFLTHWIGIVVAIGISKILLDHYFKKFETNGKTVNVKPKKLMVIYRNYRYFFYGTLIYIFVFIDRILAWSADIKLTHQFIFLYEKDYEIGMDLAILIFFMLAGVLEYALASFSKFLDLRQKNTLFLNKQNFNNSLYKMYWGHVFLLIITALFTTSFIYMVITRPWGYQASFGETLEFLSIKVCIIGGMGYLFLTWGMLNSLYLFTLNQPRAALRAIFIACAANFIIGFLLSRMISYEYSVIGMLIGAILFMLLTLKATIKFFKKIDYFYYAAY